MWYIFKFIDMQIFEYLFGIFSEILMWKIYFIGLLGNVEIVEIIEELWNCGIYLHHGCVKKL